MVAWTTSPPEVRPESTLRMPSSRRVRMPSSRAGVDHAADLVVDEENFKNPHPAPEAVAAAFFAADRAENRGIGHARDVQRERAHFLLAEHRRAFADRAKFPHEALGEHRADGGGDEERFDSDVRETGHRGGRIISVERGENQVTGERRVDGDVRRLGVPDFPDHDDVRRLPQHGAKGGGEGHPDVGFHHDLIDTGELIFDRILDRDDLFVRAVDDVETGVKRGRFPRAGRTGDQ